MKEENGPLIALVVFVLLSGVFGYFAYDHYVAVIGDENNPSLDKKIGEHVAAVKDLKEKNRKARNDLAICSSQIKDAQSEYSYWRKADDDYTSDEQRRNKLFECLEIYDRQVVELAAKVDEVKNKTLQAVNADTTGIRDTMDKESAVYIKAKEESQARQRVLKEELAVDERKFTSTKNYERAVLANAKGVLSDLTQRDVERAEVMTEVDGHVILADIVNNIVVIDIGSSVGVKNGFRFEVYNMRPGNKKVFKCFIQVIKVTPSKADCVIIRRPVELPRDPLSSYVAEMPEEKFSPYQQSGRVGSSAQALTGTPRVIVLENTADPVVEGDVIQNPFFSPKKLLTIFIAGDKAIKNEVQKSAIAYKWTEIKATIEAYGGKVIPTAEVGCDYMIAQKNPQDGSDAEKAAFVRAKDIGLPVIYEWELFRFLENK